LPNKFVIVSGGQTGADRAAFDSAIAAGLEISGFVPLGRWAEDGDIPRIYKGLTETDSSDPSIRTRLNVETSDATLILSHGKLTGGSLTTWKAARNARKPCLHIDLERESDAAATEKILLWIHSTGHGRINIAGPRASKDPQIYSHAREILDRVFAGLDRS
jgi:hypothetical protein